VSGLCAAFWSKGADPSCSLSAFESRVLARASAFSADTFVSCDHYTHFSNYHNLEEARVRVPEHRAANYASLHDIQ